MWRVSGNHGSSAGSSKGPWCSEPKGSRMKTFDYVRPATIREAIAAATEPDAMYLAAGTNLLDLMKGGVTRPNRLVDITHLPDLDRIEDLPDGGVRIGALVRNAATVGGNILQRTRCAYFYDVASACNKRDPGSGCDARGSDNSLHAVMGWSESCIATHPSDFCVPLVALDAIVEVEGRSGAREVPLELFHRLPADAPHRETVLEPGEMIVAVRLPAEAAHFAAHARYLKVRDRTSYAFAVVSAAAALRVENDAIEDARLALGGVAMKPWRARAAERVLAGARTDASAFRGAAEAALADAKPSGDNGFKIELARRVVVRALTLAAAGTPARLPALPASPFAASAGVAFHA